MEVENKKKRRVERERKKDGVEVENKKEEWRERERGS